MLRILSKNIRHSLPLQAFCAPISSLVQNGGILKFDSDLPHRHIHVTQNQVDAANKFDISITSPFHQGFDRGFASRARRGKGRDNEKVEIIETTEARKKREALVKLSKEIEAAEAAEAEAEAERIKEEGGPPPRFPTLEEFLAMDAKEEAKKERQQKHLEKQAAKAVVRVQTLDEQGRAVAIGRRKRAIAKVWMTSIMDLKETPTFVVNDRHPVDYFHALEQRMEIVKPFETTGTTGHFHVVASTLGGGLSAQAGAIRLAIARALQNYDPTMRPSLKSEKLLTRDWRKVERKKPGQKKARKKFQWVKR